MRKTRRVDLLGNEATEHDERLYFEHVRLVETGLDILKKPEKSVGPRTVKRGRVRDDVAKPPTLLVNACSLTSETLSRRVIQTLKKVVYDLSEQQYYRIYQFRTRTEEAECTKGRPWRRVCTAIVLGGG